MFGLEGKMYFRKISKNHMLKPQALTLVLILLFFSKAYSQLNYEKGFVVMSSDTISGYIAKINGDSFNREISFKKSETADPQNLSVDNCSAFGFGIKEVYESHWVNVSMGSIDPAMLSINIDTSFVHAKVFLQVVNSGRNVTLFKYTDNLKTRFFIKKSSVPVVEELLFYRYKSSSGSKELIERKFFITQLSSLFDYFDVAEKNKNELTNCGYEQKDLLSMVDLINNDKLFRDNKKYYIDFFAGAGISIMPANFIGDSFFAEDAKNSSSPEAYFQIGLDAYANPVTRRLKFRFDLGYGGFNSSFSKQGVVYVLKQKAFLIGLSSLYSFYHKPNFKVAAGFGVSFNYLHKGSRGYSKTSTQSFELSPEVLKSSFYYPFFLNATVKNRIEATFRYSPPSRFSHFSSYGLEISKFQVGINYIFTKKPSK